MELRDYQAQDVKRIVQTKCIGVFSEQRTGKTPTAIRGMTHIAIKILVVCPYSLMYNWQHEFKVWANIDSTVIDAMDTPITGNVVIVNYEKLADTKRHKGLWETLRNYKFQGMIIDEAHRIKSISSLVSNAVLKIATKIPFKLALTGTPAHDRPEDVFNILHFLQPRTYPSYWKFVEKWCNMVPEYTPRGVKYAPDGIKEQLKPAFAELLNSMCIMHKRAEVMDWSTYANILDIPLPLTDEQKVYLENLSEWFSTNDGETSVEVKGVLDRIIRYRQICTAPAILKLKGNSPKLDWIKGYLKDNKDKSVLIFSNSKKFLNIISAKLHIQERIDGDAPAKLRQQYVDMFQAGQIKVLLIQTQAGKEGLTLDQADTEIFCDVFPPASDYLQAKDRFIPTDVSKVKPRSVYRLMMQDSYDEELYQLVDKNIKDSFVVNDFIKYIKRR